MRATTALVVGLAAIIPLTACGTTTAAGGDGRPLTPAQALTRTAAQVKTLRSYRVSGSGHIKSESGKDDMDAELVLLARRRPDPAFDLTYDERTRNPAPRTTSIRLRLVDGRTYRKIDISPRGHRTAFGRWDDADLPGETAAPDIDAGGGLEGYRLWDPMVIVQLLPGSTDTKSLGVEPVGGVPTTHYAGTFDMARVLSRLSSDVQIMAVVMGVAKRTLAFDLWIDDRHLPRRVVLTADTGLGRLKITVTASGFNEPVVIASPPTQ